MADQIARLDAEIAFLDQIAAELERQVGPSPVTRPPGHRMVERMVEGGGRIETRFASPASLSQSGLCRLDASSRGSLNGNCNPRFPAMF